MSLRANLGLVAVAGALGGSVYWFEVRAPGRAEQAEAAAHRLVRIDPEVVTVLEVPATDADGPVRLVRAGPDAPWRLESPVATRADQAAVAELLRALEELSSKAVIEGAEAPLEAFGLGAERGTLRVRWGEEELLSLHLGGRTPLGLDRYVSLAAEPERIYTVEAYALSSFEPRLLDLRDRRILLFEPEQVRSLQVTENGVVLVRAERSDPNASEGEWRLTAPAPHRADSGRLRRVIGDLSIARATGFIDDPEGLERYGLEEPELEIELTAAQEQAVLRIGRVQDRAYVQRGGERVVYEISDRVLMNVPRRLFAYRFKRVLEVDADRVVRLELEFPREDASYAFVRKDRSWASTDPELEAKPLSVEDVVYAISALDAVAVEEGSPDLVALGLDPPRVRVRARDEAGEELAWLELGDPVPGQEMPARSSTSSHIWRVPNETGADIPLGLEAFRRNFLEETEGSGVTP